MTSVESRIRDAASRNTELLKTIKETEHAAPDLATQNRYIADLQSQIEDAKKSLSQIAVKRKKEFKEHESYRDSVMKRFAYKATGKREKFEARAKKEEEEYFEALQTEQREEKIKKNLEAHMREAREVRNKLEGSATQHQQAQQELDSLYEGIFAGPTPGFQEEDQKEQEKDRAIAAYQEMRSHFESENQVVKLLSLVQKSMFQAANSMEEALSYSRYDMFGGGSMADMMERNALHQAETWIHDARMTHANAQRMSPNVGPLPPVKIAQGNLMSDVFFDNIFTDMAFHDKIKASMQEVQRCVAAANAESQKAGARAQQLTMQMEEREAELDRARRSLQKARETAFERTLGGGSAAPAPASVPSTSTTSGPGGTEDSAPPPYIP